MPRVSFTSHLSRHVDCPSECVEGTTVREVLESYFSKHAKVKSYVLDDQGALRKHVVVFVGEAQASDPRNLTDPVAPDQEVYVMQALSGG